MATGPTDGRPPKQARIILFRTSVIVSVPNARRTHVLALIARHLRFAFVVFVPSKMRKSCGSFGASNAPLIRINDGKFTTCRQRLHLPPRNGQKWRISENGTLCACILAVIKPVGVTHA
jgi:hypothetical protein